MQGGVFEGAPLESYFKRLSLKRFLPMKICRSGILSASGSKNYLIMKSPVVNVNRCDNGPSSLPAATVFRQGEKPF
jgi:hypothetical protein